MHAGARASDTHRRSSQSCTWQRPQRQLPLGCLRGEAQTPVTRELVGRLHERHGRVAAIFAPNSGAGAPPRRGGARLVGPGRLLEEARAEHPARWS
ncbi:MAG: hypothetical protein ACLP8S_33260 [Solirubrobacteraceae bacterium]